MELEEKKVTIALYIFIILFIQRDSMMHILDWGSVSFSEINIVVAFLI
jgi:hypothetical protein